MDEVKETKETIIWCCPYCLTDNQIDDAGVYLCVNCRGKYRISPDGKITPAGGVSEEAKNASIAPETVQNTPNTPEKTLTTIANIVLWVNIIACVILFIVVVANEMPILLVAIPLLLITPILFWAFTSVFVNISNTLKEINQKLKSE